MNFCFEVQAKHYHIVIPRQYMKDNVSWYVQDNDFYDKKLVAIGIKTPSKKEFYPLFKNVFDINQPTLYSLGAAGLYNTKGAMFLEKEDTSTGLSYITAALLSPMVAQQLFVFYNIIEAVAYIPVVGQVCAAVGIATAAFYAEEATRKIIIKMDYYFKVYFNFVPN